MSNEWQPAILLPEDRMCEFHRQEVEKLSIETQQLRRELVGQRVWVRPTTFVADEHGVFVIDSKECVALAIKRADGAVAGCFSCEVQTD